jgi:hypothetical protein
MYNEAVDINGALHIRNTLAITCNIISKATNIMSPKHLGLGIRLHHDVRSRTLIEELSILGYCIPYTEPHRWECYKQNTM